MIKKLLKDDKFFIKLDTKHLKNLSNNLGISISDIKNNGKYRNKVRKRILENI